MQEGRTVTMSGPAPGEIPPALAAISINAVEEMEGRTGRPFGKMIDELVSGEWSIETMRELVLLVAPERELVSLGDLIEAAQELFPKDESAETP
jgi:hypothetical protein